MEFNSVFKGLKPTVTKSDVCCGPAHTSDAGTFTVFTCHGRYCTVFIIDTITSRVAATLVGCSSMLITQCNQKQQHLCQQVHALRLPLTPRDVIVAKIRK